MNKTFKTNKKPFILALEFVSSQPMFINIEAQDKSTPNTHYYKKKVKLDGSNKFKIKFSNPPDNLVLKIYPDSYKTYNEYIQFSKLHPKRFDIVKTDMIPIEVVRKESVFSRYVQRYAVDAIIIN